jgi:hypothetical protein
MNCTALSSIRQPLLLESDATHSPLSVKTKKDEHYNHNFIAGLAYCTSTLMGLGALVSTAALSIFSLAYKTQDLAADATDAVSDSLEEIDKIPETLGLRRYFSIITGISNTVEGVRMIQEAHHEHHKWGKWEGCLKAIRGIFEASSGCIQGTTTALKIWAEEKINLDAVKVANVVGDFFACIQFLMIAAASFNTARLASKIRHEIKGHEQESKAVTIFKKYILRKNDTPTKIEDFDLRQRQVTVIRQLIENPHKHEDRLNLKKIIGDELYKDLHKALKLHNHALSPHEPHIVPVIDKVLKALAKSERNNIVIGILSIAATCITIAADFATAGIASQILNILKPIVSLGFFYYDAVQLKSGIEESKASSKLNTYMRYALTIMCIAIVIATFVGSSAATGGALPIALLVIGIICPLISLYINNNKEKVAKIHHSVVNYIKNLNPFKKDTQTSYKYKAYEGEELLHEKHVELSTFFKKTLEEGTKAA